MINYEIIKQIARDQGMSISDLCALAPKNDPFYTGRPSEVTAAQWFADIWKRFGYWSGVHLRRVHYQLVSQDPPILRPDGNTYLNTDRDWGYLNEASKWARYLGLVRPNSFVDRRNPDPIINANWPRPNDPFYDDPTPGYSVVDTDGWDEGYDLPELPDLDDLPEFPSLPTYLVEGYEGVQQAIHIECWVEKTTMNDVLVPLCRQYGVNLIVGAGELSITAVVEFLQRVRRARRPARIIYISDFDPAGIGMPISIARKIEYFHRNEGFGDLDIRLQPVALTADQIAEYKLPRVPVKDSDLRKTAFELAFGEGQVELDALEALYPGQLRGIVEASILQYYDPELRERALGVRRVLEDTLISERQFILKDRGEEISNLTGQYDSFLRDFAVTRQEFADLVQVFQPKIDAHRARLEAIKSQGRDLVEIIVDDLSSIYLDLTDEEYALPEADLPEEGNDQLYISGRDYITQLVAYKKQRHGLNGAGHEE